MATEGARKLERFGRYLILDHMVDGGMASICRARYLGEQADKIVAIKMVQPQYSKDESFKTMFMDEIKVTFGLIHPNIAQTYDYGIHQEQLYTAMEYVDGRNLKEYLDKLKERKFVFPVGITVYIISQVCQGLHYAHTLTDKLTGKQVNIIHRDISPHNIMLTYDGAVKVIDFGIAKAETNSEATQAGTIKGKLSYLAPEYLEGQDLDPRYDQFAVGITLWEMLCSRKLFKAKNDLAVLKQIQACKIAPPSSINPNVPKELDQIVLKALSKDRNKRYSDLDQLNRALVKFLYSHYPDFNATDLAYFAGELFKEDIEKDRKKMFEFGKIDLSPFLEDLKREQEGKPAPASSSGGSDETSEPLEPTRKKAMVLDFGFEDDKEEKTQVRRSRTRVNMKRPLIPKVPGAESEEEAPTSEEKKETPPPVKKAPAKRTTTNQVRSQTTVAKKAVEESKESTEEPAVKKSGTKKIKAPPAKKKTNNLPRIAALLGLILVAFLVGKMFMSGDEAPQVKKNPVQNQVAETQEVAEEEGTGTIEFTNFSRHQHKLYINGERVEVSVLGEVEWPYSRKIVIRVQKQGFEHFVKTISLGSRNPVQEITIPEMPASGYAYLVTSRECISGKLNFTLFGEERVANLPIKGRGIAFPVKIDEAGQRVPQEHTIYYKRTYEEIQRKITFIADTTNVAIDLCNLIAKAER